MHDAAGKLQIIPADVKEKLHHLPPGYTQASFLDDTTRHRMLANCWHWGVARRLLACEPDKSFQHRFGHVLILCGLYRHRGFYCSGGVESFFASVYSRVLMCFMVCGTLISKASRITNLIP